MEILDLHSSVKPLFEPFWFNSDEYTSQLTGADGFLFYEQKDQLQLFFRAYEKEGYLVSPLRAPFGSMELSEETGQDKCYEFVKGILDFARERHYKGIKITAAPECYDLSKADLMDEILIHAGFSVTVTELNYHLDTNLGVFETFVHNSEKRRLKKCQEAGFVGRLEKTPDLKKMHQLITDCRERKGYPLSMNVEDFEKMFQTFPERYLAFTVNDGDRMIATAVGVKVRSDILYNFLPADDEEYLAYSPTVLLNKVMYDYCCDHHFNVYDLGIATVGGNRNEGLIRFKEHLGGILSHKYSYEIRF